MYKFTHNALAPKKQRKTTKRLSPSTFVLDPHNKNKQKKFESEDAHPDRDPRESRMTEQKVEIGSVSRNSFPVIIESEDGLVWQRHTADRLAPAIVAILILVDIVTKMEHIVHRILARWVAKRIEEAEREVGAAVDRKTDLSDQVVGSRRGLGAPNWAADI